MSILFHSGTETTSGSSESYYTSSAGVVGLFVNITARSGTLPTLVVKIQHSPNDTEWYDVPGLTTTALSSVLSTSIVLSTITPLADYIRCTWTVGGVNPSFTFTTHLTVYDL